MGHRQPHSSNNDSNSICLQKIPPTSTNPPRSLHVEAKPLASIFRRKAATIVDSPVLTPPFLWSIVVEPQVKLPASHRCQSQVAPRGQHAQQRPQQEHWAPLTSKPAVLCSW